MTLSLWAAGGVVSAASGDRDGAAVIWDVGARAPVATLKGHKGHLTALAWLPDDGGADAPPSVLLTGAQDGHLRAWDVRSGRCVANVPAHTSEAGAGAIGDIALASAGGATLVVSSGADKAVCVLDPAAGFAVRHRLAQHKDFIYSLHTAGALAFSGAGDGMLLAHDVGAGRPLWGLGANEAAVRCVAALNGRYLVAAGDDGKAIVYDFA
jgi:WD40 repeat protein